MFKQIPPIGLFVLWLLLLTGTIFFSEWVQIKSHESSIKPSFENLTTTNAASKPKAQVHPEKAVPEDIIKYVFVKKGDTLMKLLVSNGVDKNQAANLITSLKSIYELRSLPIGHRLKISFAANSYNANHKYNTSRFLRALTKKFLPPANLPAPLSQK